MLMTMEKFNIWKKLGNNNMTARFLSNNIIHL